MRPPSRPMRPTSPTVKPAVAPVPVVEAAPAPVVVAIDWRGLAFKLLNVVEQRRRLGPDLLKVVNVIRAADGREPRVEVNSESAPAPVVPEIAPEPAGSDDALVFGDDDIIDPRDQPRRERDDPDDPFGVETGRGIVEGDPWLDPQGEAARREATPAEREANQAHLERERARMAADKKRRTGGRP